MKTKSCSLENACWKFSFKRVLSLLILMLVFLTVSVSALSVYVKDSFNTPVANAKVEVYGSNELNGVYTVISDGITNSAGFVTVNTNSAYLYIRTSKYDYGLYYPETGLLSGTAERYTNASPLEGPLYLTLDVTPLLWTDKSDYQPEETVYIYGSSFDYPFVDIKITIPSNPVSYHVIEDVPVINGMFETSYLLNGITSTYTIEVFQANTWGPVLASTTFVDCPDTCTVVIQPSLKDSFVNEGAPSSNYGSGTNLTVSRSPNRRAYIQFNLSSIPAGKTINYANLRLYQYGSYGGGSSSRIFDIFRVIQNWNEGTITWDNKANTSGSHTSTTSVSTSSGWKSWNVTSDVQAFVSGTQTNHGWMIKDRDEGVGSPIGRYYYSKEYSGDTSKRPKLEIQYEGPCGSTPVCGNEQLEPGEQCEKVGGQWPVCCNTNCTFKPQSTPCQADDLFCTVDHCDGQGNCVFKENYNCSQYNQPEVATCTYNPDNKPETFDYAAAVAGWCDEANDRCEYGNYSFTHTCADADGQDGGPEVPSGYPRTCNAECDGYGTECQPYLNTQVNYCYYNGQCSPTSCACQYSGEYCPPAGTVSNGVCYYGTRNCTENGCTLSEENMTCRDICDQVLGPIDTSGPVVSKTGVYPNPAGPLCPYGIIINGTATENCTTIADAEYYIYLYFDTPTCQPGGKEKAYGKMNASDGMYDELIEDVTATFYLTGFYVDGGAYQYCVKAKNSDDVWGECVCKSLEIDDEHPVLETSILTNYHWIDSKGYWVCANNFTYQALFCDSKNESCIAAAEYLVKPPNTFEEVYGRGIPMLPADGSFSTPQQTCEWANGTVINSQYSEGAHEIKSRAIDCACNPGKIRHLTPLTFIIDRTPPRTTKTVGEPKFQCNYFGDENEAEECWHIKRGTLISFSAQDVDNSWDGNYSDAVKIYYRYRWKRDYNDTWGLWSDWFEYTTPFQFIEDSIHELEYYSVDRCGNKETHRFEIDIVDSKPPVTTKTIGTPKIECNATDKATYGISDCWYMTGETPITLQCVDQGPHPIDTVTLYYTIEWKQNWGDSWQVIANGSELGNYSFSYNEFEEQESYHRLTWYCVDALNNTEATHVELDIVDSTPPATTKTIIGPQYYDERTQKLYIDGVTEIELNCTDPQPHPVNDVTIYYKYRVGDGEWPENFTVYTGRFSFPEESRHELVYYCVDELGNQEIHQFEIDYVDHTPPNTTKIYGQPFYSDGISEWITSQTPVTLIPSDGDSEHSSGVAKTYWRNTLVDNEFCASEKACMKAAGSGEWKEYEGPFYKQEESCHLIEFYSIDNVNKTEEVKRQCVFVDNTPPVVSKTLGEPKIPCFQPPNGGDGNGDVGPLAILPQCDYWITQDTVITLNCADPQPHPVNHVTIYYRYSVDRELNDEDEWTPYTEPFTFEEDSVHYLEYYCEDGLGNRGETYYEIDKVDSTPPTTIKTYGTPFYAANGVEWINSSTSITLTAEDGGEICAVGVSKTYWRNTLVDNEFCASEKACMKAAGSGEWKEYEGPFYKQEESCHLIEFYSVDALGNAEEVKRQCVFVDNTPPVSNKTVGTPNKIVDCSTLGQGEYTDGCYYVTSQAGVEIDCTDPEPHPVNDVKIYYKIDWKNESGDEWQEGQWIDTGQGGIHINFENDSYHRLSWYCVDALNNTEQMHTELDIVDNKPPVITKFVGEPKHACEQGEECDYYITQNTNITLTCVDQQPHPVDGVTIYYRYSVDDGGWVGPFEYNGQEITFRFPEDSVHYLEYWCVDELGNKAGGSEVDIVDTQPPVTTKMLGDPKIPGGDFTWITSQTTITLTCEDPQPHPVDHVKIYYRYSVDGGQPTDWILYQGPFTFGEDSVHYLEYYCVDELGNTEQVKNEIDKVDNTPPKTNKILYGCYTPCNPGEGCDYWVGPKTKIGFEPVDGGEICAVGVAYTHYRYRYMGRPWNPLPPNWHTYDPANNITFGSGYFNKNGYYYIQYYSRDHLGNEEVKHNETDIYDNKDPFGFVLNPVSGRIYHDGETFAVYAPAADAGYPPSGVANCEFYAIDINYEGINQSEINNMWEYLRALQLNNVNYTLVYLGQVPYVNGVCKGLLTIPKPSNITDKAWLMMRITDRSCNEWFGYARDSLGCDGRKILMDFDNEAPRVVITDRDGLEGLVGDNHKFVVYASIEEYRSGADECWADLFRGSPCIPDGEGCEGDELVFVEHYPGTLLSEYRCRVSGTLPKGLEDDDYTLTVFARDEEFNIGNDSVRFQVDGTPPTKTIYSPAPGGIYGPAGIPIKIGVNDTTAGVNESSVQYRIYAPGADLDAICIGACPYDSGWRSTTLAEGDQWVGNYTALHNTSGMTSGAYYVRARGCDVLGHCVDPLLGIIIDLDPPVGPTNVLIDTNGVITWNAATDALSGMSHYNIYFNGEYIGSTNASTLTYTTNGTSGNYSVSAVDKVGNEGQKVLAQPPTPFCGDGTCNAGETCSTCPADCGNCPSGGGGGSSGGSSGGGSIGTSGGSTGTGGNGQVVFTQCSSIGQPCATTADCCEGQCVNYKCAIQEGAGLPTRVDILAPPSALLNDVIVLQLVDESGTPIPDGTVLIISPTRESLILITDSEGKAGFRATDEGVYTYSAPGHYLVAIRTTNVVKPTQTAPGFEETPEPQRGEPAPPSIAMALTSLAPWILGLLVLLLIVIFLATRGRKQKK